jgi:Sec-independent protein translocase protein TatA
MLGGTELFVILCGIVVLFGADRASNLARSAGETLGTARQHKHDVEAGLDDVQAELEEATTIETEAGTGPGDSPVADP